MITDEKIYNIRIMVSQHLRRQHTRVFMLCPFRGWIVTITPHLLMFYFLDLVG